MSDSRHTRAKRKRSLAKLFEATTIWAIVAGAVGWLVYQEITQKTLEIEQAKAGRKLLIQAENLHGVSSNSQLICQGLTVGKISEIEATPMDDGELKIAIHAQLDERYSKWSFGQEAEVSGPGFASGLTGTSIILKFAGLIDENLAKEPLKEAKPQFINLNAPEDMAGRLRELLGEAETIIAAFTEEVPAPEGWPADKPATKIDVLTTNLATATEALSGASEKLESEMDANSEESLMGGLHRIESDLGEFMVNSNELITEIRSTVDSIDSRFDDTLGASKSERAALRKEAEEVLTSLDTFVDRLDDLASRTGDTFIGRALIRNLNPAKPNPRLRHLLKILQEPECAIRANGSEECLRAGRFEQEPPWPHRNREEPGSPNTPDPATSHPMKKSFPLEVPGMKPPRVIAAIKNDVRKYIKRERRKELPEEADFCDFDCRVGTDPDSATDAHVAELIALIDTASRKEWPAIYIEILAKPGYRTKKPDPDQSADE